MVPRAPYLPEPAPEGASDYLAAVAERAAPLLAVIDQNGDVLAVPEGAASWSGGTVLENGQLRFSERVRSAVRTMVARYRATGSAAPVLLTGPEGQGALRLTPLCTSTGRMFVLSFERMRDGSASISRATRRFGLTRRESEVLALVLHGAGGGEIARTLGIAPGTVQGYLKRLLAKTGTSSRAAMVACVLAWEGARVRSSTR
ncbi:MAG: LuxR C-terminal-related transcriptional regulator [Vulcanimicrobiaceae bacterium]